MNQYKQGLFFSYDFVGENSWNGYEYNCLFANVGNGEFVDVARPTGADGLRDGRGVAVADFDDDGRLDIVINNNNAEPTVFLNAQAETRSWLRLALAGRTSNRDAVGARVSLTVDGKTLLRQVEAGSGYASQHMLPIHFGLGDAERIEGLEVRWPSGHVDSFAGTELEQLLGPEGTLNRTISIEEGTEQRATAGKRG